jgi:cytidylate kinase
MAIITIGGNPGSGKTTLAGKIAKTLHYQELYIGGIFRELAAKQGLSIEEFYMKLKDDPNLERSVDDRQIKMMQEHDNCVIQGRIAWHFAKQSPFRVCNICVTVDPVVGAGRQLQRPENKGKTIKEIMRLSLERTHEERERYRALYGIEDYLDPAHYDFVLNATALNIEEVLEKVLVFIR